jgi:hypothetical protein
MSLKIRLFYILILSFLIAGGCKKDELPPDVKTEPVFGAEFTFDGTAQTMAAGENGLVQSATYLLGDSGIVLLSGLSVPDCSGCGPALSVRLESPEGYVYSGSTQFPDDLQEWDIRMQALTDPSTFLEITANTGDFGDAGLWSLNGASLGSSPTDMISFAVEDPDDYTLLFSYVDDTCTVSAEQNFSFDGSSIPCYGNIQNYPDSLGKYTVQAGPGFNFSLISYIWTVGDSMIFTGSTPSINIAGMDYDQVCVEINQPVGCNASVCMASPSNSATCHATVHIISAEVITEVPVNDFARLILEYTDENGVMYTSDNENQADAEISLISLEPYTEPTMSGENFLKALLDIDCMLYDAEGNGYEFSGEIVVAFAYP